jgi:hypothetical protein
MPNGAYGREIYLSVLVLSCHWKSELRTRGSRLWIETRIPADCEERRTSVDRFDLKIFVAGVNCGTKSLYPAIEGACVNTKIW